MSQRFAYQVCRVNFGRVTFVNDAWQGAKVPEAERKEEHIQGCPAVAAFLQCAGAEGWELVAVSDSFFTAPKTPPQPTPFQVLYLKRPLA